MSEPPLMPRYHAAAIASVAASVAVMAGCEATLGVVTAGAATLACGAISGAVGNAVGYAVNAAQHGGFSWSGLGKAALTGAVAGLAGGVLGSVAGLAVDGLSGLAGSLLSSGEDTAESVLASGAADEAAGTTLDGAAAEGGAPGDTATAQAGGDATEGSTTAGGGDSGGGAAEESDSGNSCEGPVEGGESFTAGTLVLLASGAAVPISALKPGDTVLAADVKTGKDQPEKVTAVLVHHDTDLYNLTVKTTHGTEVIHTTTSHLFWDPSLDKGWIPAYHLKPGTHLKTPDGRSAVVVGGTVPAVHDGWMWDLTVPGNGDHDFYVEPATVLPSTRVGLAVAVLVHNSSCRFSVNSAGTVTDNQGPTGIVLNKASGDGFRDTVASFLRSQGRTVTTDADSRSANTFQALGKPRILDMMVQDDSGSTLGYVETKYGSAAAKYEGSFQQEQDEWLRQNMGLTIDVVSGG